jgi:hypothetical protein
MHKNRVLQTMIAIVLSITLACVAIPTPPKPTQLPTVQQPTLTLYSTSTSEPTKNFLQNLPTPEATVSLPLSAHTFADTKLTDISGNVVIEDSLASVRLNINLQDITTKKPLDHMQVQFISDENEFLLVAFDSTGNYLPAVKTDTFSSLSTNVSSPSYPLSVSSVKAAPLWQDGFKQDSIELDLVNLVGKVNSAQDLTKLLQEFPSIEKWGDRYVDTCWTGKQLANAAGILSSIYGGVADAVLPIGDLSVVAAPESSLLSAVAAISLQILTPDAQTYLNNLPDVYRLRFISFQDPISFIGIIYLGKCDSPAPTLNHSDFISVAKWVSYSIIQNHPEMIADVIDKQGIKFWYFATEPPSFNTFDSNSVANELKKGLVGSSPQCLGYYIEEYSPDKATIIYKGINFDWAGLGMDKPDNDTAGFQFYQSDDVWNLVFITPMPNSFWNDYHIKLDKCP